MGGKGREEAGGEGKGDEERGRDGTGGECSGVQKSLK